MKKYKTKHIEAHDEQVFGSVVCDLCGDESEHYWRQDDADAVDTTVRMIKGAYDEGVNPVGIEIEVDICPKCFEFRLLPWLRSQGAHVEWKGWEV